MVGSVRRSPASASGAPVWFGESKEGRKEGRKGGKRDATVELVPGASLVGDEPGALEQLWQRCIAGSAWIGERGFSDGGVGREAEDCGLCACWRGRTDADRGSDLSSSGFAYGDSGANEAGAGLDCQRGSELLCRCPGSGLRSGL
jgi:hypothetical protein